MQNRNFELDKITDDLLQRKQQLQGRIDARGPLANINLADASRFVANLTGGNQVITKDPLDDVRREQQSINKDLGNMALLKERLNSQNKKGGVDRAALENLKHSNAMEKLRQTQDYKKQLLEMKLNAKGKKSGKALTNSSAQGLGDLKDQYQVVDNINKEWGELIGNEFPFEYAVSGLANYTPWDSDSNKWDDKRKVYAQSIGKALEGGKLTDVDYEKYYKMLPSSTDSPERAKEKLATLKRIIESKHNNNLNALRESGADIGTIRGLGSGSFDNVDSEIDSLLGELGGR